MGDYTFNGHAGGHLRVIAAWVQTHPHSDHTGVFDLFHGHIPTRLR